jgi:hypothetical protein
MRWQLLRTVVAAAAMPCRASSLQLTAPAACILSGMSLVSVCLRVPSLCVFTGLSCYYYSSLLYYCAGSTLTGGLAIACLTRFHASAKILCNIVRRVRLRKQLPRRFLYYRLVY